MCVRVTPLRACGTSARGALLAQNRSHWARFCCCCCCSANDTKFKDPSRPLCAHTQTHTHTHTHTHTQETIAIKYVVVLCEFGDVYGKIKIIFSNLRKFSSTSSLLNIPLQISAVTFADLCVK